jgi:hypothetical protein
MIGCALAGIAVQPRIAMKLANAAKTIDKLLLIIGAISKFVDLVSVRTMRSDTLSGLTAINGKRPEN